MIAKIKCPYCGVESEIWVNPEKIVEKQIVLCNCDEGGCDRNFVAFVKVVAKSECKKIEGC